MGEECVVKDTGCLLTNAPVCEKDPADATKCKKAADGTTDVMKDVWTGTCKTTADGKTAIDGDTADPKITKWAEAAPAAKGSNTTVIIGVVAALAVVGGVAAYMMMSGKDEKGDKGSKPFDKDDHYIPMIE